MKQLQVIFEDNHLIAINKPAGALVQGDKTGDRPITDEVKFYIKHRYNKPGDVFLGTIHRLDRPVSGVLIFARTSKALIRMNEIFRNKQIKKEYLAVSNERPNPISGVIKNYLLKDPKKARVSVLEKMSNRSKNAKLAETEYELMADIEGNFLIRVFPKTGRSHQIRVHLASIGSKIIGDMRYGMRYPLPDASIALHCRSMEFMHPVKKELVKITAEVPNLEIWRKFKDLLK